MSVSGTGIEVMVAAALSGLTAQCLKLIGYAIQRKPVNFRVLVETGGMPSSHSASMTGLAFSVGLVSGFSSVDFAIAAGLALIVMYDAAGVRRAAGRMAGILNKMTEEIYHHESGHVPERLRELLGHTPKEVVVGAMLGILIAYWVHVRML